MLDTIALFLDVDGTLLPIAETPQEVQADAPLIALLRALSWRTRGALAFISGRTISQLDALFAPLRLPTAGMHGFERRDADGAYLRHAPPPEDSLAEARRQLRQFAASDPCLLLEDKRFQLAVHYRRAPALEPRVLRELNAVLAQAGPAFELQRGKCVVELRAAGVSKGIAVRDFLQERPFRGRYPIYIGDDLTDESAFETVNLLGGLSISVGGRQPTRASINLAHPEAVHAWLRQLHDAPDQALATVRDMRRSADGR